MHHHDQPEEDGGEMNVKFSEDQAVLDHVEGLGHVHHADVHITIISEKVINGFNSQPCTHCRRAS